MTMWHRKNGALIASVMYAIVVGSLFWIDIWYVMVIFSCLSCWFWCMWTIRARFFRAKLTSYLTVLKEELSNATSTDTVETINMDECRKEIVLTMVYFSKCVRELETGVWTIDISKEKKSVMSLVTAIDKSPLDFGDREYFGRTYRAVFERLSRCANSQAQRSPDEEEGIQQLPGPDFSGPQVVGDLNAPANGAMSPAPSVVS